MLPCDRSSKKAAVATMCGEFMAKLSLLYVTLRPCHGTFAAKKKAVHASIKPARGEARGALRGISGAGARAA